MIAQTVPSAEIDNGMEFVFYLLGVAAFLVVGVLGSSLLDALRYRRGKRRGKWPTTKVSKEGGWHWTCWYCNEVSELFPTREAAEGSASQHTDHVERTSEPVS